MKQLTFLFIVVLVLLVVILPPTASALGLPDVSSSTRILDLQADALSLGSLKTWQDASGFSHNFSRGAGASGLVVKADANGKKYVEFNMVDDWMLGPNFADNLPSFTVFIVSQLNPDTVIDNVVTKMTPTFPFTGYNFDYGGGDVLLRQDANNVNETVTAADPYSGERFVWTGEVINFSELHDYANGNSTGEQYFPTGTVTNISNPEPVRLGNGITFDYFTGMNLSAVMIYAPAPNASDRAAIECWLGNKYGVSISACSSPTLKPCLVRGKSGKCK